jgi:hypothetical protein
MVTNNNRWVSCEKQEENKTPISKKVISLQYLQKAVGR